MKIGELADRVSREVCATIKQHEQKLGRNHAKGEARGLLTGSANVLIDIYGHEGAAEIVYRLADQIVAEGVSGE